MKNIAEHILDIAENSIRAQASRIDILLSLNTRSNLLKLSFVDNGCGMSEELIDKIENPFFSTRKTRHIGMGIPLLKQNSERSGGDVYISSQEGKGSTVVATFGYDNIDCPPLGKISEAIYFLSTQHPHIRFIFDYICDDKSFRWDTQEVQESLGDVPLQAPEAKTTLLDLLYNNIKA